MAWQEEEVRFQVKCPEGEHGKRKRNEFLKKHDKMTNMVKLLEVDNVDKKRPSLVNL